MILNSLHDAPTVYHLHPLFRQAFEYIFNHSLQQAPAGRITLIPEQLFINVDDATLRSRQEQKLEVHRRYVDIHVPLSGEETVGWTALHSLTTHPDEPFNEASDFALYTEPAATYFTVRPGEFYIMYPEDAHAPIIGSGTLRKLVVKVLLDV